MSAMDWNRVAIERDGPRANKHTYPILSRQQQIVAIEEHELSVARSFKKRVEIRVFMKVFGI